MKRFFALLLAAALVFSFAVTFADDWDDENFGDEDFGDDEFEEEEFEEEVKAVFPNAVISVDGQMDTLRFEE